MITNAKMSSRQITFISNNPHDIEVFQESLGANVNAINVRADNPSDPGSYDDLQVEYEIGSDSAEIMIRAPSHRDFRYEDYLQIARDHLQGSQMGGRRRLTTTQNINDFLQSARENLPSILTVFIPDAYDCIFEIDTQSGYVSFNTGHLGYKQSSVEQLIEKLNQQMGTNYSIYAQGFPLGESMDQSGKIVTLTTILISEGWLEQSAAGNFLNDLCTVRLSTLATNMIETAATNIRRSLVEDGETVKQRLGDVGAILFSIRETGGFGELTLEQLQNLGILGRSSTLEEIRAAGAKKQELFPDGLYIADRFTAMARDYSSEIRAALEQREAQQAQTPFFDQAGQLGQQLRAAGLTTQAPLDDTTTLKGRLAQQARSFHTLSPPTPDLP